MGELHLGRRPIRRGLLHGVHKCRTVRTDRALRRNRGYWFWNLDCFSAGRGRVLRISDRVFHEDPEQAVEPSAFVVVAADGQAADPAGSTLERRDLDPGLTARTALLGTGRAAPPGPRSAVRAQRRATRAPPALAARAFQPGRDNRTAGVPAAPADRQIPRMLARWLAQIAGGTETSVSTILQRLVDAALIARFEGRCYLAEVGIRRAAILSGCAPIIRSRPMGPLTHAYRRHEQPQGLRQLARAAVRPRKGGRRALGCSESLAPSSVGPSKPNTQLDEEPARFPLQRSSPGTTLRLSILPR